MGGAADWDAMEVAAQCVNGEGGAFLGGRGRGEGAVDIGAYSLAEGVEPLAECGGCGGSEAAAGAGCACCVQAPLRPGVTLN